MANKSGTDIKKHLSNLLKARFPIIYIPTWEEGRAIEILNEIAIKIHSTQ